MLQMLYSDRVMQFLLAEFRTGLYDDIVAPRH